MILQCGHAPNSTNGAGEPSCVICVGIGPTKVAAVQPNLADRMAKCGCGRTLPSDPEALAFFEYRGVGSRTAETSCLHCGYADVAHDPEEMARRRNGKTVVEQGKCRGFEPHGAYEFDAFYCGHFGWE